MSGHFRVINIESRESEDYRSGRDPEQSISNGSDCFVCNSKFFGHISGCYLIRHGLVIGFVNKKVSERML